MPCLSCSSLTERTTSKSWCSRKHEAGPNFRPGQVIDDGSSVFSMIWISWIGSLKGSLQCREMLEQVVNRNDVKQIIQKKRLLFALIPKSKIMFIQDYTCAVFICTMRTYTCLPELIYWTLNLKVWPVHEIPFKICKFSLPTRPPIGHPVDWDLSWSQRSFLEFQARQAPWWRFRVVGWCFFFFGGGNVDSLKSNMSLVKVGQCWVSFKQIWTSTTFGFWNFRSIPLYHIYPCHFGTMSWTETRGHLGMTPGPYVCALPRDRRCQRPVKFLSSFSKWQWIWALWDLLMTPWERRSRLESLGLELDFVKVDGNLITVHGTYTII